MVRAKDPDFKAKYGILFEAYVGEGLGFTW